MAVCLRMALANPASVSLCPWMSNASRVCWGIYDGSKLSALKYSFSRDDFASVIIPNTFAIGLSRFWVMMPIFMVYFLS